MKINVVHAGFGTFFTIWTGLTLKDVNWNFVLILGFLIVVIFILVLLDLGINMSALDGRRWMYYVCAFLITVLLCSVSQLSQLLSHPNVNSTEVQPTVWLLGLIVPIWIIYTELTKKFNKG